MSPCPPADQLLGFAAGTLSDDLVASTEAHIDECAPCRTSLSGLAQRNAPASMFGRYQLETVLGSGGMGIVYRAWDPQLARPVAIKVVKQAADDEAHRARLVREAQSLARLSHPHVCQVYDVGTEGDEVWVAMELIEGVGLRAWAGEHERAALIEVLLDAAEGLAAAHAAGLVHRDIKPENVLVSRDDRAIVTDFGLARVDDQRGSTSAPAGGDPRMTRSGAVVGTPAYLAPEQLTGAPIDARADQFAWAVMAWELLTGMRPFPIIAGARLDAIRAGLTPPPTLGPAISAALARALQIAPRDRFGSMTELISTIRDAHAHAPRARRSPRTALLAASAAVLLAGAAVAAIKLTSSTAPGPAAAEAPHAIAQLAAPIVDAGPLDAAEVTALEPPPVRAPAIPKPAVHKPGRAAPPSNAVVAAAPARVAVIGGGVYVVARPFSRDRAISTLGASCGIPIDAAHPDPKLHKPIADWGKVTKHEIVVASIGDRDQRMSLYEVVGQRATYHFDGDEWNDSIGQFEAQIGQLVALCSDDATEIYTLPGAWRGPLDSMRAMVPISAVPRTRELASLDPLHIDDLVLRSAGDRGKLTLDPARRYLVHAKVVSADGDRWEMERWWLEVPRQTPGAALVAAGARRWFVIEHPVLEDQPDGNKPHLVVRAVAVLDSLFPE